MIDDIDSSASTLRLLASRTLKPWNNKAILALLLDEDYVVRTLVARELQMRGDQDIYYFVVNFATAESSDSREICAFVLGQLGTPSMPFKTTSLPVLQNLILDRSSDVRAAAAAALGHICYEEMPAEVEDCLFVAALDESPVVRSCVAASLGRASRIEQARGIVAELLRDPDQQVREYAELDLDLLESLRV